MTLNSLILKIWNYGLTQYNITFAERNHRTVPRTLCFLLVNILIEEKSNPINIHRQKIDIV